MIHLILRLLCLDDDTLESVLDMGELPWFY